MQPRRNKTHTMTDSRQASMNGKIINKWGRGEKKRRLSEATMLEFLSSQVTLYAGRGVFCPLEVGEALCGRDADQLGDEGSTPVCGRVFRNILRKKKVGPHERHTFGRIKNVL